MQDDTRTFFTSDPHWFHTNIIRYAERPFATIDEMHAVMIERWNAVVRPHDIVVSLGDLSLGRNSEAIALQGSLNGTQRVVAGNHDAWFSESGASPGKKDAALRALAAAGIETLPEQTEADLVDEQTGQTVTFDVSHFPYVGDHAGQDRYSNKRMPDLGRPMLHGHVHQEWLVRQAPTRRDGSPGSLQLNVGVDVHGFSPVHSQVLVDIALGRRPDLTG